MANAATANLERGQLSACRWGFLFVGAGLFLEALAPFALYLWWPRPGNLEKMPTEPIEFYLLLIGAYLCALLPGSHILLRNAHSPRWHASGRWLLLTIIAETVLLLVLAYVREPGVVLQTVEPLRNYVLMEVSAALGWIRLWWLAVMIAEFCLAARAARLVEQTERLGFVLLAGLAAELLFAAWFLPHPVLLQDLDHTAGLLRIAASVILLVAVIWTLYLLAVSATLARFLSQQCG